MYHFSPTKIQNTAYSEHPPKPQIRVLPGKDDWRAAGTNSITETAPSLQPLWSYSTACRGRSKSSKAHPEHQLDLQHPEQPRAFIWMNTNIPPNLNHSLSKTQVFTVTKQTPVQLQDSAVPHAVRKVSGCRSECIIGLIYSYQHGTWFESSITVTSHSGVCMLQRVSKLERNLPPAAEHYITINRKQAESSRRSPSLACTVMLMEMYTHSSICTYYGACQTVGLHGKKDSRTERDKIQAKSFKIQANPLRFLH